MKTTLRVLPVALVVAIPWAFFLSGGLRSIVAWLAFIAVVPLVGLVLSIVALVRIARRRSQRSTWIVLALGVFALWPGAWNFGRLTIAYPYRLSTVTPSATVRLPLDGPVRVAWGGDDLAHNQHASMPDQRWAYDLTIEPAFLDSTRLTDYGCYGKDVVAPMSGEVWRAHDGEPEQVPSRPVPNFRAPLGNHVVLKLPTGTFLLVAHLQTGSIGVHDGQHVNEGDVIGRCGNSGNTSEPHVHIHHQRQDPRRYPVGVAEGLPLYFRDLDGPVMPRGGLTAIEGKPHATGDVVQHVQQVGRR